MHYVNIANYLYDSDERLVISTQIYTAFVAYTNKSDTNSEITILCTHTVINTFNVSQYSPMLLCVDTGTPFSSFTEKYSTKNNSKIKAQGYTEEKIR